MERLSGSLNAILVGSAVMLGWWLYGWKGLFLALSMIVFWMILQFNRATRVVAKAAKFPKGHLSESVVMIQSALSPGMTLGEVIAITGSLGIKVNEHRDDWRWDWTAAAMTSSCPCGAAWWCAGPSLAPMMQLQKRPTQPRQTVPRRPPRRLRKPLPRCRFSRSDRCSGRARPPHGC